MTRQRRAIKVELAHNGRTKQSTSLLYQDDIVTAQFGFEVGLSLVLVGLEGQCWPVLKFRVPYFRRCYPSTTLSQSPARGFHELHKGSVGSETLCCSSAMSVKFAWRMCCCIQNVLGSMFLVEVRSIVPLYS